jgi:hypothetical protein
LLTVSWKRKLMTVYALNLSREKESVKPNDIS